MKKILVFLRKHLSFRYNIFTEFLILLFIFLLTFPVSIIFQDLLKIPQNIFIPFVVVLVFIFTRLIYVKIEKVEELFHQLRMKRQLVDFITLLLIFYAFIIIFFGFIYFMIATKNGFHYSYYQWIYFSVISLTTVGYGDIAPINDLMRLIASIEAFIGYISPPVIISIGLTLIFKE